MNRDKDITFFLSTRNRADLLYSSLESIQNKCANSTVLVGNASSGEQLKKTSQVIASFKNAKEILFNPDPGICIVYNKLHEMITTPFGVVWCDDLQLIESIDSLLVNFDNENILLVALPMIDDVSHIPGDLGWPTDKNGCALWNTPTGRCAHISITRTRHFQALGTVCGNGLHDEIIDNYFHKNTTKYQRIWPTDKAYVYHKRRDDETRWEMLFNREGEIYRHTPEKRKSFKIRQQLKK